jgi:hypothetical protein
MEDIMGQAKALLYYGMGRFLSYVPAGVVAR